MSCETIVTDAAPAAVGPYAQAIAAGGFLFCSGQLPIDPATGALVAGGIEGATRRVLANLRAVLAADNLDLRHVVKTTVFLADMNDFAAMNAVYAEVFGTHKPARACIQVSRLPKDARVEIEAVAVRGNPR